MKCVSSLGQSMMVRIELSSFACFQNRMDQVQIWCSDSGGCTNVLSVVLTVYAIVYVMLCLHLLWIAAQSMSHTAGVSKHVRRC